MNVLGIFVKHPLAGAVKTRLASAIGARSAALLYAACITDVSERFRNVADVRYVCFSPEGEQSRSYFRELAGDDYQLWPQPGLSLGERLHAFFEHAFRAGAERTIVIGSDSPTLPAEFVAQGFNQLTQRDCVLGPAMDGGYYLVGMRNRQPESRGGRSETKHGPLPIFDQVDWSTPRVFEQTRARIEACGATLGVLPPWYDVDTIEDLAQLRTHFQSLRNAGNPARNSRTEEALSKIDSGSMDV